MLEWEVRLRSWVGVFIGMGNFIGGLDGFLSLRVRCRLG